MNDLRSPMEDRPYRPSAQPSPRLAQDDNSPEDYEMSFFDRVRYSRWFPLASVFAAVLVFSGVVSFAYKQGSQTGVNATTPVVAADTANYKEKPENPGGMDVPFQDAVVFDQLQNSGEAKPAGETIESLLPPPEQPVAATTPATTPATTETPAAAAPVATDAAKTATATAVASAVSAATTPAAATSTAPAEVIKETPAPQPLASELQDAPIQSSSPEPQDLTAPTAPKPAAVKAEPKAVAPAPKPVAAPKAVAAPVASSAVSSGSYRIQLGAFRDEAAARSAWNSVKGKFSQLSSVTPAFPRADLGAKGIFYRAQGVNLSKESADSLCRTINASKAGSCIVAH